MHESRRHDAGPFTIFRTGEVPGLAI
jgi:hypothetical protein